MAFWSSQTLKNNLGTIVQNPDPSSMLDSSIIDCNSLTLSIGNEVYITSDFRSGVFGKQQTKRLLANRESFAIPSGQFAFLHTQEIITIPENTMGFISFKTTYKLNGLVNVSGFHVDPGWRGQLIFSVFNAGPSAVHLEQGLPFFLLWVANLDAESLEHKKKLGEPRIGIPMTYINQIPGNVESIHELKERVNKVEKTQIKLNVFVGALCTAVGLIVGAFFRYMPVITNSNYNSAPTMNQTTENCQINDKSENALVREPLKTD